MGFDIESSVCFSKVKFNTYGSLKVSGPTKIGIMRVGLKVHWLTKIRSWNVINGGLFFNIVIPSMLQGLDPLGQKGNQMQI